jgi:hypothetical protein
VTHPLIRARLVREDAARDAEAVDRTPFTPHGVGSTLGSILAQIAALATCIEELGEDVRALSNRIESVQKYGFKTRELVAEHIEVDTA